MGYQLHRFIKKPPINLICSACKNVYKDPLQCTTCQQVYCSLCMNNIVVHTRCKNLGFQVTQVTQFFTNKLNKLQIKCQFCQQGCLHVGDLASIAQHQNQCQFQSSYTSKQQSKMMSKMDSKASPSLNSTGSNLLAQSFEGECKVCHAKLVQNATHDCVQWLFTVIQHQNQKYSELKQQLMKQQQKQTEIEASYLTEKLNQESEISDLQKKVVTLETQLQKLSSGEIASSDNILQKQKSEVLNGDAKFHPNKYIDQCTQNLEQMHKFLQDQVKNYVKMSQNAFQEHKTEMQKMYKQKIVHGGEVRQSPNAKKITSVRKKNNVLSKSANSISPRRILHY